MSGYEILERCVCRLPNFIPYLVLALLPFQDSFRFSKRKTWGLALLLTLIDCFFCFCSAYTGNQWQFTALSIFFYAVIFLLAVRTKPGKILFVLFLLLNYAALVAVSAIYLISRLYPSLEKYSTNRFGTVWVLIVVVLLTMPLVWFYINRKIRPLINSPVPETERSWRMLWLIPAVFYCIYYYGWYANWSGSNSFYDYCAQLTNVLFVIFLNLGSLVMYGLAHRLLIQSQENLRLQRELGYLNLATVRFEQLQDKMEEVRKARHDLRHHLTVIDRFLKSDDLNGMRTYLESYSASMPDLDHIQLCQNPVVNSVASYYSVLGQQHGVDIEFSFQLPQRLPLTESDFCSLLGNLLENAWEACLKISDGRRRLIRVKASLQGSQMLVLLVENSYQERVQEQNGHFYSSKRQGYGIGLESVRSLVVKYHGVINIHYQQGIFQVNILLNL